MNSQRSSRESSSSPKTRTPSEYNELYDYLFGNKPLGVLGEHISQEIDGDVIFPQDPPLYEKIIDAIYGLPADEHVTKALLHIIAEEPVASSRGQPSPNGRRERRNGEYGCIICDQTFGTKGNLYCHVMEIHVKIVKFRCETCGTRFTRKSSLDNHVKIHSEREKTVCCKECGNWFGRSSDLNKHTRVVHEKKRPMQCPVCCTLWPDTSKLRRHMETHERNQAENLGKFEPR